MDLPGEKSRILEFCTQEDHSAIVCLQKSVHTHRALGRNCDHCNFGGNHVARPNSGQGSSKDDPVSVSDEANWLGDADVR
jgi:hypothetical protein